MVSTDLQGLVSPHQQADRSLLLVFQQLDVTGSSFLPLLRLVFSGKTKKFGPPEEKRKKKKKTTFKFGISGQFKKKKCIENVHFEELLLVLL